MTADLGIRTKYYSWTNGLVAVHTDERGMSVTNYWDNLQRPTSVVYPDGTSRSYYYSNLDLSAIKDRMTNWTAFAYNGIRQKTAETNAITTNLYNYCECGALNSITNGSGSSVQAGIVFYYDYQGRRTNIVYADATSVTNLYDPLGRLIRVWDGVGWTTNAYDNLAA